MKKFIFGSIAIAALAAGPAMAADLAVKAPIYKAPPMVDTWSWSGFYLGGNIGYSFGRSNTDLSYFNSVSGASLFATNSRFNLNGAIGGGQVGVNWQSGTWVLGLEADLQASGQKGDGSLICPVGTCAAPIVGAAVVPGGAVTDGLSQKLTWLGTVRGRVGMTVTPTVLAYVTGGLAYGEVKTDLTVSGTNGIVPVSASFGSSTTKAGWTIGGGLEGRISGNWTAKIEYLYVNLGTVSGGPFVSPIVAPGGGFVASSFSSHVTDNIVRVGINYKFDNGPVVAKY